jgi:RimJ/RimL family protein N-acetyltransferase
MDASSQVLPRELRTARLLLRAWRGADAEALRPVLLGNQEHLRPWIPEHVYSAPPLTQLTARLDEFASNFAEGRSFRYALREPRSERVLGSMSLFPRDSTARVELPAADRVELGYWLDASATGQGFVTEAARALLEAAARLPGVRSTEIHCHVDNAPSSAVPRRLGFKLVGLDGEMQVWRKAFAVADVIAAPPD